MATSDEARARRRGLRIATWSCVAILSAVMVGVIARSVANVREDSERAEHDAVLEAELESRLAAERQTLVDDGRKAVSETMGVDYERKDADDSLMRSILSTALTWSDANGYREARRRLIEEWHVPKDCQFLKEFFADVVDTTRDDGSTWNVVDENGTNVRFEDMRSFVTKADGDKCSYIAEVNVSSVGPEGYSASDWVLVTWSTDKGGKITDMEAHVVA